MTMTVDRITINTAVQDDGQYAPFLDIDAREVADMRLQCTYPSAEEAWSVASAVADEFANGEKGIVIQPDGRVTSGEVWLRTFEELHWTDASDCFTWQGLPPPARQSDFDEFDDWANWLLGYRVDCDLQTWIRNAGPGGAVSFHAADPNDLDKGTLTFVVFKINEGSYGFEVVEPHTNPMDRWLDPEMTPARSLEDAKTQCQIISRMFTSLRLGEEWGHVIQWWGDREQQRRVVSRMFPSAGKPKESE